MDYKTFKDLVDRSEAVKTKISSLQYWLSLKDSYEDPTDWESKDQQSAAVAMVQKKIEDANTELKLAINELYRMMNYIK